MSGFGNKTQPVQDGPAIEGGVAFAGPVPILSIGVGESLKDLRRCVSRGSVDLLFGRE